MGSLNYFLGIQVTRTDGGGLLLSQERYVNDLLKKAEMQDGRPCVTPLPSTVKFFAFGGSTFNNPKLYRSVVGSLQYLTVTRPELAYCILVKCILHYIRGTSNFGLLLQPADITIVAAYSDSDWGGDPDDKRSTGDFCVLLGKNLVSWCSKKQGLWLGQALRLSIEL
ncbi:uncharacterized protein LOC107610859 [Arachis ipaensis]|uniref:uncharacterized protein LOC107610859 n=1 Tax=Arachis ipaensis TaxID=130454 RepID=UPI0007AFB3AD|nr:uncharacterized protein LOC107610859 [Arachis ipaensis]XP_025670137.1 uncharacterized protein LOC112769903 [Arachis hypogaea]